LQLQHKGHIIKIRQKRTYVRGDSEIIYAETFLTHMAHREEWIIVIHACAQSESVDNRDVISFFSGAMGLDIGLQMAGLNVKIGQDFDKSCVETMRANGHKALCGDIRETDPAQVLNAVGMSRAEPFLVCGGPPCQPFSTAGKRLGISDPRGGLFKDFIRMIDFIRPRFFLMENVKGLMSASADIGDGSLALDAILQEFQSLGYKTVYGLLDAVNYGVPQFRERFVLLGSRDGEGIFLPLPTHFQTHQNAAYRWRTLRSAISDLESDHSDCASFSAERMAFLKTVPEGGNWRNLAPDCVEKAMGGAYASGGGKVGFYRRLSYDAPSPTLVTSPVQKASMLCHPTQDRPLSVREYARLQQFPDGWAFSGSTANRFPNLDREKRLAQAPPAKQAPQAPQAPQALTL
jgi:DNA (cytosine-5)-methyltransferase 1